MICIACMHEKEEKDWMMVHCSKDETTEELIPNFCVCKNCAGKETEYPTLKSIH